MIIEKGDEVKLKVVLGSDLQKGKVYIGVSEVGTKSPVLYQVVSYGVDKLYVCNLGAGTVYPNNPSIEYIEVEAKVVWGLIK